jgi:beta-glucanase (GH16 family)
MRLPGLPLLLLAAASAAAEWREVWRDDFAGAELDWTRWAVEENGHGGGNNELQYYRDRPRNVRVENGHLVLEAHREAVNVAGVRKDYSSGRIRTKRRADWLHGRFEITAQLPAGKGLWPAFWMLPSEETYGGWAASGEIDIMELRGGEPDRVHGTLHFGGAWPRNVHRGGSHRLAQGDFASGMRTFALEWERGSFRWFVDGVAYHTETNWSSEGGPFPAPFDRRFHLILNLAVGGGFGGPVSPETRFPAQIRVDTVRVLQR